MTPHIRKLLPAEGNPTHTLTNTSPSPSSSLEFEEREKPTDYAANNNNSHTNGNPPFDSAMALTVLALLTALLFMSFFSIYIRHFARSSSSDSSYRRRRRSSSTAYFSATSSNYRSPRSIEKGVDPITIQSIPVHAYGGRDAKQAIKKLEPEIECAICLSEFEERDWVKEIPYCGHVFHVECIDTWLSSHVTCPLCRTAKLFPAPAVEEEEREKDADEVEEVRSGVGEVQENEVRLVVDEYDTWQSGEGERLGVRRSSSCTRFGERMTLNRSLSF